MKESIITQDLELWEAWVEFDHLHPSEFGTLYVLGEAPVSIKEKKVNFDRSIDPMDPGRLIITIPDFPPTGRVKMKEVVYSETVKEINTYHSIVVCKGDEILVEITDIEVLI